MKKRRLYRYSAARTPWPNEVVQAARYHSPYPSPEDLESRRAYELGLKNGLNIAIGQQDRLIAEARNAAIMSAQNEPSILSARRNGYEQGFAAGMQAGRANQSNGRQFTYADLEQARRRGMEEGRMMTASSGGDAAALQQKIIDKVMDECRVISESNPNMAPGVNALKHRIKKIV